MYNNPIEKKIAEDEIRKRNEKDRELRRAAEINAAAQNKPPNYKWWSGILVSLLAIGVTLFLGIMNMKVCP